MVLRILSNSTDSLNFLGWIWLNSFSANLNYHPGGTFAERTQNKAENYTVGGILQIMVGVAWAGVSTSTTPEKLTHIS